MERVPSQPSPTHIEVANLPLLELAPSPSARYRSLGTTRIDEIAKRYGLPDQTREDIRLVSQVLPFRVNDYVLDNLVDWQRAPIDPMFQLMFPQRAMLPASDLALVEKLTREGRRLELRRAVRDIRMRLNPHPSGQLEHNVPQLDSTALPGVQHKYRETVLYFPSHGQQCHAFCTYCFRWAQFVGDPELRFAATDPGGLIRYLRGHPDASDVLVTGGDPLVMSTRRLAAHVEPLLQLETVRTIRIGTKSLAYWPLRFTSDADADDLLQLFERIVASGRQCAVMAHFSHPRELATDAARNAVARIRSTGATVYCQAPLIAHVNDSAELWEDLWRAELSAGATPYYMFVARDTGPYEYFKVSLARALEIYGSAYRRLPGLARTVRGPVMSATAGKIVVDGIVDDRRGRRDFQLRFLQARDPALIGRPFSAAYCPRAAWIDELVLDASVPADIAAALGATRDLCARAGAAS
jgi:KamA family protein